LLKTNVRIELSANGKKGVGLMRTNASGPKEKSVLQQDEVGRTIRRKLFGAQGGSFVAILHGSAHFSAIAKKGWNGPNRERRLETHRKSIAFARAALKKIRELKRVHGTDWMMARFREKLNATGDPKAALRSIMGMK
jgi:hypothetical protein